MAITKDGLEIEEEWIGGKLVSISPIDPLTGQAKQIPPEYMDRLVDMPDYLALFREMTPFEQEAMFGDYQLPAE